MSAVPVDLGCSFVHDGHRLVYDVYGRGDDVVLYTHGLLLDSEINRGIAQALAEQGNRVVLLDLLGHDELVAFLDHLPPATERTRPGQSASR